MGTPEFAVPSLDNLVRHGYDVPAVITGPDKPRGRGQELSPTPVKAAALKHSLRVLQPDALNDPGFIRTMKDMDPDVIAVVAFRILPKELFSIPRSGSFNLHASLLPKYRGAAPINWVLMNGEQETGVTTFFLEEKVDTGKVILQARVPILAEDDAGTLHDRLAQVGADIVVQTVHLIEQGRAPGQPQDNSLASPAPKIFKDDCRIDWLQSANRIHNRIRGLSPHPTAFTTHAGRMIKLYRSRVLGETAGAAPGEVLQAERTLVVATADQNLEILELQQEGRKRMGAEEFLRGYRLTAGETLT